MPAITAAPTPIKFRWLLGTLLAFALFAGVAVYSSRMAWHFKGYEEQQADIRRANLKEITTAENKQLYPVDADGKPTAEWIDEKKGIIRIPIEEAMAKEVDALMATPAQSCTVPMVTPPPPAPAKPEAAAPAPPTK